MGYRDREIEIKLEVQGLSFQEVNQALSSLYSSGMDRMVYGKSSDTYWHLPSSVGADFARMRELEDGRTQITVKAKDRGNAIDRMEIDVETFTAPSRVARLLKSMLGKPGGKIEKQYYVYWIDDDQHTTISCYIVDQDPGKVFIEVESTNESQVLTLEAQVLEVLADKAKVGRAAGSLYDMYISDKKEIR